MPFKETIVYDGLMSRFNISFGPGIRRSLKEFFKQAKARHGIVTSLPMRVWMLEINGFIMDVREASREVQEIAFEKGLIPYIPADRK